MRILYIYSDWKWTGPSQPIVELCDYMSGHGDVAILTSTPKNPERGLISYIESKKIFITTTLMKRGGIVGFFKNRESIRQCIREFQPDIIHTFRENDLASLAGDLRQRLIVFTDFAVAVPNFLRRTIWRRADVVTTFSKKVSEIMNSKLGNVVYINPWLNTKAQTQTSHSISALDGFKIYNKPFVIGLIMRIQPHRRFDLVIETAKRIKASGKNIVFLILGRGKARILKQAKESSERFGLANTILFGGYRKVDYWDSIHCFDVMLYTVPGSDGTARALRQCQAMGKPVICLRNDSLLDIVHDNVDGFMVGEDPDEIASCIYRFYDNKNLYSEFSRNSLQQGFSYSLEIVGEKILRLYEKRLHLKKG
jgi:glycosyltransferase involved in cell wall biosynthesis